MTFVIVFDLDVVICRWCATLNLDVVIGMYMWYRLRGAVGISLSHQRYIHIVAVSD